MKLTLSNFLNLIKAYQSDIILVSVIVLITIISFQSGRIYESNQKGSDITVQQALIGDIFNIGGEDGANSTRGISTNGNIALPAGRQGIEAIPTVASKNSNKYHFPWCPSASKIADKNKITFPNEAAAIAAGLVLASNCQK